ncbi:MAG: MEDS domain-containing protein [Chlamydiota bacterium]
MVKLTAEQAAKSAGKKAGIGHRYSFRTLSDLQPGEHLCCIFRTPEEHRQVLTRFLRDGLERRQKVLYVYEATPEETIQAYLRDDGLDPAPYLRSGQLVLIPASQAYLRHQVFRPEEMLEFWKEELARAQAEGYAIMRVTGETTWAERGYPGTERFMEYEARLNEVVPGSPVIVLCQYDLHKTSPKVLLDVLLTHPVTGVGTDLFDNFYYLPPEKFLSSQAEAARLQSCLQGLKERRQVEQELQLARQQMRAGWAGGSSVPKKD